MKQADEEQLRQIKQIVENERNEQGKKNINYLFLLIVGPLNIDLDLSSQKTFMSNNSLMKLFKVKWENNWYMYLLFFHSNYAIIISVVFQGSFTSLLVSKHVYFKVNFRIWLNVSIAFHNDAKISWVVS